MNDLDNERLNQLRNYAQWERDNGPAGKLHILDWAAEEITRLRAKLAEVEGQEAVATLTVNETTMSASYHLDPLSVLPIGEHSLYTHPAPAKVPDDLAKQFASQYATIKITRERNASIDRPTDFAIAQAQGWEIVELRRLIEAMLKSQGGE